jgi:ATP-dependent 26S proteasome regulatory subunit
VVLMAATNRRIAVEPALCHPGRLDCEVWGPVPDAVATEQIRRWVIGTGDGAEWKRGTGG